MKALLDTNILIDFLNGVEAAREELSRYREPSISTISWMEVMVGVAPEHEPPIRQFLSGFRLVAIDQAVAERAASIRRAHGMRLPDAIIWSSAQCQDALLVTRNNKDFPEEDPGVRVPYHL